MNYELILILLSTMLGIAGWISSIRLSRKLRDMFLEKEMYKHRTNGWKKKSDGFQCELEKATGKFWCSYLSEGIAPCPEGEPLGKITEDELDNPDVFFDETIDTSKEKFLIGTHYCSIKGR